MLPFQIARAIQNYFACRYGSAREGVPSLRTLSDTSLQ